MLTVNKNSSHSQLGLQFIFLCFCRLHDLSVYFWYVLFYLGQLSQFPSCFGAGVGTRRFLLHIFQGHYEQKAMRDEGVIYVAGHPLLNRRCTRLPGCIRLRKDLYPGFLEKGRVNGFVPIVGPGTTEEKW